MSIYDATGKIIAAIGEGSNEIADNSITPEKLSNVVKNIFDLSQNTEENVYVEHDGAFHNSSGRYWGASGSFEGGHFSYLIPVKPGDKYYLQNININNVNQAGAIFYTSDKELTTQTYTLTAAGNYITVPATAAYMRIPVHANTVDTVMVLTGTEKPINVYIPYGGQIVPNLYGDISAKGVSFDRFGKNAKYHRFMGAKVGCLGDSLTHMSSSGWIKRLSELMGFASIINYGSSGSTLTNREGEGDTSSYLARAPQMSDDLDLIIVMTSINDNGAARGVYNTDNDTGTLEDADDKTVNDVTTIAGAEVELIKMLRVKYPSKDIVFFSHPHTHWGLSYSAADICREVCGHHAVPFFDMLRYSGIDGTNEVEKATYFTDGIHLTEAGNERVADYMAACLRTL